MKDKKQTAPTEEKVPAQPTPEAEPQVSLTEPELVAASVEPQPSEAAPATAPAAKRNYLTYGAVVLVVVALLAVWSRLESEGRVATNVFGSVAELFAGDPVVVTVDGEALRESDLELSIEQLSQGAAAQGVDPTTEAMQADIRSQAIDMLVNTTLLTNAAAEAGVEVTDEDVAARRSELEEAAGGPEVLAERMAELEIDSALFEEDIRTELVITELLEGVFADADLSVTDEEVQAVYDRAAESGADVPPLEDVRSQIEQQIISVKEQDTVTAYIDELRGAADIEISE